MARSDCRQRVSRPLSLYVSRGADTQSSKIRRHLEDGGEGGEKRWRLQSKWEIGLGADHKAESVWSEPASLGSTTKPLVGAAQDNRRGVRR